MTCPTCRLSIAASAAASPFQNCPRCILREQAQVVMVIAPGPHRFGRAPEDVDRIVEARSRLTRVTRPLGSA